jgi:hypothetical protein
MKADQIIDAIIIYMEQNGIVTDETLIRRKQLLDLFCATRAKVLSDFMINGINPTGKNYLRQDIERSDFDKNNLKYSYFEIPAAVMNAYDYVGGSDGCSQFREATTFMDFKNTVSEQVPRAIEYFTENEYLKVDESQLPSIMVTYIPSNPINVPTFNYEIDEFPLDDALLNVVMEMMFATYQSKKSQVPNDTVSDSNNTIKSIS